METERIELSAGERERLKVLQQVEEGHLKQVEAARRLRLSDRQVRRLQARVRSQGDRGIVHRLPGCRSNRKIGNALRERVMRELRQARYTGFGPTLAAEHLARQGIVVSRETLRSWMDAAGLWQACRRKVKRVHVMAAQAQLLRRTGDDGQLAVSVAGGSRSGVPLGGDDRRRHEPRLGSFGGTRFDRRKSAHIAMLAGMSRAAAGAVHR